MMSMNYKRKYGYEINPILNNFVHTESSARTFIKILAAFSSGLGACLRGKNESGKREQSRALSWLLAQPFFEWNFDDSMEIANATSMLTGFASGKYWLYVSGLEKCHNGLISAIASIMFSVRKVLI